MLPLNLGKNPVPRPKTNPPYNKTQEQERKARQTQHLNNKVKHEEA